jgi:gamma-glutamylputrescine oxidase
MPAAYPESYYTATMNRRQDYPALQGELRADVCVIGGGYTGLSSAIHLAERGYTVALLEAERIGWGASGRNGGQCSVGQRKAQDDLGCLQAALKHSDAAWYRHYAEHMQSEYGFHMRYLEGEELEHLSGTDVFCGGLVEYASAHLHPLNFALGLADAASRLGVQIFENSRVGNYDRARPTRVTTGQGSVTADYVVLGCNGYLERLEPRVAGKIMPLNNFIIATEPLSEERQRSINPEDVCAYDAKFVVNFWKLTGDGRMLFGGGENYTRRFPSDIKSFVRKRMLPLYPQLADARIDYGWGGTLAVTMNRMPSFGCLDPDVFYALGFSGHGVQMATLAGKLIAEAVAGTAERFDVMARIPSPTFPGGTLLRWPGLVVGMLYHALKDRLGD